MLEIPKLEKRILAYWAKTRAFEKSLENRKNARPFIFYEGPPTANGMPGIHHVLTRVFKDAVCRYKTMRGYRVERKAGWDTHGLPVELEVEKELGLKNKRDIEKFGIAKFNARCRTSVWKYKKNWEDLTRAIGFWLDMDHPYSTYDTAYTESVWWILKRIWEKKLLYQDYKVVPFCPRCETALSSHEVALGYKNIEEDSVYIKFKLKPGQNIGKNNLRTDNNTFVLVWTTTPWTLPANVALAVGENIDYVFIDGDRGNGREKLIIAKEIHEKPNSVTADLPLPKVSKLRGVDLLGLQYEPLYETLKEENKNAYKVYAADFVTTTDGTGVVHIAPMYGEDDHNLGKKHGLPNLHTVELNGMVTQGLGIPGEKTFVKEADKAIIKNLKERRILFLTKKYIHDYPFCWRCDSPLLYYAQESWFIRMSALKGKLIASNKAINWVPSHLREGRFGEWLRELKDWALSRQRYWGTPLPLWICSECGREEAIGSVADLAIKTYSTNRYFILRHGEAESNVKEIISSNPRGDTSHLTPKGRRQLQRLSKTLGKKRIDLIYTSDFFRTKETAEILAKHTGSTVQTETGLREYNMGVFNGRRTAEYDSTFPNREERFDHAPKKGETSTEVKMRMLSTLQKIDGRHTKKAILIVSHGDPLWLLEGAMKGMSRRELIAFGEKDYIEKGELRELHYSKLPYNREGEIDLHRPYVDGVTFACTKCHGTMKRVPDLIDVWFDSGAMPFAQNPAGFRAKIKNKKSKIKKRADEFLFPADYICEAMDQTRGWFYTLLAISTLLGFGPPYKNVVSLGWVLDKHGKKMSKSRGNIVNPWEIVKAYGADSLRWYFYTVNQPGEPKFFDEKDIRGKLQRFILTYWNTLVFFETYIPKKRKSRFLDSQSPHVLDKWILARLRDTKDFLTKHLDRYDLVGASRELETFLDDLSNWYVRRSRRRFQKPESRKDPERAAETLGYVLFEFTKLSAPFVPFIAEAVYQQLSRYMPTGTRKESVHLEDWPRVQKTHRDKKLLGEMETVRRLASLALKARREARVKVRQPLRALYVKNFDKLPRRELLELLKDEINIKEVHGGRRLPSGDGFRAVKEGERELVLETRLTPELEEEGTVREIVRILQDMRKDAKYKPTQMIEVFYGGGERVSSLFTRWGKIITFEAGAKHLVGKSPDHLVFDVEREIVLGGKNFWLGIKRS